MHRFDIVIFLCVLSVALLFFAINNHFKRMQKNTETKIKSVYLWLKLQIKPIRKLKSFFNQFISIVGITIVDPEIQPFYAKIKLVIVSLLWRR